MDMLPSAHMHRYIHFWLIFNDKVCVSASKTTKSTNTLILESFRLYSTLLQVLIAICSHHKNLIR